MRAVKGGVGRHLIHTENGGVALSLVFRYVYMPNMGGYECLQVGIVSTKFPEHVYIVKMATLRSGRVRLSFSIDFVTTLQSQLLGTVWSTFALYLPLLASETWTTTA